MGLDFTHSDAHWSYSGFHRFRTRLAKEIGITLDTMEFFGGTTSFDYVKDDIVPLLIHSDCDEDLTPEECAMIAPRLRALIDKWDDDDYDKIHATFLAEGMEDAASENEVLEFI
jgi:hypothetical protein